MVVQNMRFNRSIDLRQRMTGRNHRDEVDGEQRETLKQSNVAED
jgi:hypothetical protein